MAEEDEQKAGEAGEQENVQGEEEASGSDEEGSEYETGSEEEEEGKTCVLC